jgi:TetR/AcrR family transcriptional regulator, transcriptional repressor for nem operon
MRERIVQAAAGLVAEKGVAGVSLDDVRARTGASRSQLHHYSEDRDDLIGPASRRTRNRDDGQHPRLNSFVQGWASPDGVWL